MNGSLAWTIVPAPRANAEGEVAAVHESGNGTSRHFRSAAGFGRYRGIAGIDQATPIKLD
jgi:hypothetical protein